MIEIVLAHTDLARVRFAYSPARELIASIRILQDGSHQHMHSRWLSAVRGLLGGLRIDLLTALTPPGRYLPGFLMPPPTEPWGCLVDELDAVVASAPAVVRAELDTLYQDRPLPTVLRPLYENPTAHLPAVADQMSTYWRAAVDPGWDRLRALSMADVSYRMEQFARGGIARVLGDLHPELSFVHDRLQIDKPQHQSCHHSLDLPGAGVLLLPCVFLWPALMVECCDADQPALTYPPRGVAGLWEEPRPDQADPLFALVGRSRARLLAALGLPRTTTQLAEQLDLSPAAVSQHLKILKGTGLVTAQRRGRMVFYQRTGAASSLLAAGHDLGQAAG